MTKSPIIWLLGDGKLGHENQSLGLTDAIARRLPCEVHRISLAGKRGLFHRVQAANRATKGFPKPDLIIAAGHSTHLALLFFTRKYRAKSIVLMKPSLPMAWFDLCIIPAHDFPNGCEHRNVILTRGALNRVAPPGDSTRAEKIILIGGPSASHGWDDEKLLVALAEVSGEGEWQLADSRRTPEGFLDEIRKRFSTIKIFPHQQTTPEWLPGKLATADEVWVTEDSVSMVYEALSSGAKVGVLPVPRIVGTSRVLRGLGELVEQHFLTPFADWQQTHHLTPPPETLREADRCAGIVLGRK